MATKSCSIDSALEAKLQNKTETDQSVDTIVGLVIINKTSNDAVANFIWTIAKMHENSQSVDIFLQDAAHNLHVAQRANWLRFNQCLLAHRCSLCNTALRS